MNANPRMFIVSKFGQQLAKVEVIYFGKNYIAENMHTRLLLDTVLITMRKRNKSYLVCIFSSDVGIVLTEICNF